MFGFGKKSQKPAPAPVPAAAPKPEPPPLEEISAIEAKKRLDAGSLLLDVREPFEIQTASVKGATCIPMNQIPNRLAEIPRDREILCMCHHGMRSAGVAGYLLEQGYPKVVNVEGGIAAWSAEVDSSVPQY